MEKLGQRTKLCKSVGRFSPCQRNTRGGGERIRGLVFVCRVCAKCGVPFTGTWYDKQRKRPCCPLCWGTSRRSSALSVRLTTACDGSALSSSSSIQAQRASHDSLQKGNTLADCGLFQPQLKSQAVLSKRVNTKREKSSREKALILYFRGSAPL